ncbi:hypothetical protein PHMEG_00012185 [Phytophthora megakarya]|uniref:BED-type domain-containing protein n=1 Tax=Phytophthora megakarya TaxID=4795 RepID=A0A225WBH1_9STRA|nr:hypothetical protein PHMEG_00012185 [Phytophthora megakarya]
MVKPLNQEWTLFGDRYRVAGAKGEKVDCKACQRQVTAAVNRLQSHMRICPARSSVIPKSSNPVEKSEAEVSEAIPTTSELIDQAIEAGPLAAERVTAKDASSVENNAPEAHKRRKTTNTRNQPSDIWLNAIEEDPTAPSLSTATALFHKRRLQIEEKRLKLEIKRDQREERRDRLNLELLEIQVRKEKLLVEKEEYHVRVVLALSRKELRDQGVSEDEIDRILPVLSSHASYNDHPTVSTTD